MTDNTEKLPEAPVVDLEPHVTSDDADAVRGGATTEGGIFEAVNQAITGVVKAVGEGLAATARKG